MCRVGSLIQLVRQRAGNIDLAASDVESNTTTSSTRSDLSWISVVAPAPFTVPHSPTDPPKALLSGSSLRQQHGRAVQYLSPFPSADPAAALLQRLTAAVTSRSPLLARLLTLPPELQLHILSYLDFGELERLRRTCRLLRASIPHSLVRSLFPDLGAAVRGTCYICLRSCPSMRQLLGMSPDDARFPMASRCFECVARRDGFVAGRRYLLGDSDVAWVCRWCGVLITEGSARYQPEFHAVCYSNYTLVVMLYFAVGCGQWCVAIVGVALCWSFFPGDIHVIPPTIVNFFMAIWVLILTITRGPFLRSYHWAFMIELGILTHWVPPIYAISGHIQTSVGPVAPSTTATLVFIGLNMICRLANAIGYLALICEFKFWRRKKPGTTKSQRALNKVLAQLVMWAYPQSVEQEYPPQWWFVGRG